MNNISPHNYSIVVAERANIESGNAKLESLVLEEKSDFLSLRKWWSKALLIVVYIIVVFDMVFLVLVGLGVLQYHDEWLVRLILAGNFVEVLGLAKIVVDFLFKEPPKFKKASTEKTPTTSKTL